MQRQIAINALPPSQRQGLSYLKPLPLAVKDSINYESIVLHGHDHHHEDTNETFTAGDLKYLPGYTYLPSSYPGGPRSQTLKFANAMTTAAKLGGPHLFSTFTTNPLWVELHQGNADMEYPEDNMVLVIRGETLTPDEIDRLITTSYQQCKTDDEQELLRTFMTHHCKKDVCLKDDKPCTEFFPKELSPSYQVGDGGGYPVYKRLNQQDSRIVPCIIGMIAKFRCHINTEICSDVFIIDYLFKYIYKGNVRLEIANVSQFVDNEVDPRIPDHVRQGIKDEMTTKFRVYEKDEIRRFELMHCIPATQAAWKFLGIRTSQTQPAVYALDIELPGNEVVHFKPDDVNDMHEAISNKITVQEMYWNRPAGDAFETLTLEEFFDSYVVQHTQRMSTKSLQGSVFIPASEVAQRSQDTQLFVYSRRTSTSTLAQAINRIKFVSPAHGDLYYLRMLLRQYPSRSFDDARTFNNVAFDTCHDACIARGIVTDENEFDATMTEAVGNLFISDRLRRLFVLIVMQGQVGVQTNLEKHAVLMSLDFYVARNVMPPFHQGQDMSTIPQHTTFSEMPYNIQQDLLQAFQRIYLDNNLDMTAFQLPLPNAPVVAELESEKTKYDLEHLRHRLDHII
ncbi:helicase [Fragilaria crotonensis]|nr:helicase [Fragilaria crotonensis]